jgi:hypothetical protein
MTEDVELHSQPEVIAEVTFTNADRLLMEIDIWLRKSHLLFCWEDIYAVED